MDPFMFVIRSVPLPSNKNCKSIRQAIVHIWVLDSSIDKAQEKALSYIKSFSWNPLKVEHAFAITDEQLDHLHKDEERLYRSALLHGIAADFLASPIREKSPDSPVEYGSP